MRSTNDIVNHVHAFMRESRVDPKKIDLRDLELFNVRLSTQFEAFPEYFETWGPCVVCVIFDIDVTTG